MPRRTGACAKEAIENWHGEKLFQLICEGGFQKDVNELRASHREWKTGPPLEVGLWDGEYLTEAQIPRHSIDLHGPPFDHRDDPFLCDWGTFESTWGIRLPLDALRAVHDLEPGTVDEWFDMLRLHSAFPPAGSPEAEGLGTLPVPHTTLFRYSPDLPADLLQDLFSKEVKRIKTGSPKTRCRGDKLAAKLRARSKAALGFLSTAQIAESEQIPRSTAQGRIKAASRVIGEKPATGKNWSKWHLERCPICREIGVLSYQYCAVARSYMENTLATKKHLSNPAPLPNTANQYLPWRPVRSDKSAFKKWDSQHPKFVRSR